MKKATYFITNIKIEQAKQKNTCLILLISIIPFMILEILTHKLVFVEFAFILFLFVLYNLKQIQSFNNTLTLIQETKEKMQKTNIKRTYTEGQHIITNPDKTILNLESYTYIGKDDYGTKFYQNTTDVIVCGTVNPNNGQVIYDNYGIPIYLINN